MLKNKNFFNNHRLPILVFTVVLVLTVSVGAYYLTRSGKQDVGQADDTSFINLDPPTEEEKNAANDQKQKNIDAEEREQTHTKPGKTTHVIITDAGQYDSTIEVRAFIPDHYQDGTCTITFTQGSRKVSKETPAYRDASTTICTNPLFKRSEFPTSGQWQVIVEYRANDASGASESKTININ